MGRPTRRTFGAQQKYEIVMQLVRGEKQLTVLAREHGVDHATIERTKRVNREGLEWCDVYDRQLLRWRSHRLSDAQRCEIARLEDVQRDLRLVLTRILELADELGWGTIERQLAKSDVEVGLEYLLRFAPRA